MGNNMFERGRQLALLPELPLRGNFSRIIFTVGNASYPIISAPGRSIGEAVALSTPVRRASDSRIGPIEGTTSLSVFNDHSLLPDSIRINRYGVQLLYEQEIVRSMRKLIDVKPTDLDPHSTYRIFTLTGVKFMSGRLASVSTFDTRVYIKDKPQVYTFDSDTRRLFGGKYKKATVDGIDIEYPSELSLTNVNESKYRLATGTLAMSLLNKVLLLRGEDIYNPSNLQHNSIANFLLLYAKHSCFLRPQFDEVTG
jgi:hypothetical protein